MSRGAAEPRWVSATMVRAIHADQVRQHGGSMGLREVGLLDSALGRPRNRWHYEPDVDLAALAAAYGYGLTRNHPFVDGSERVAFQAMYVFLGLNGHRIVASEPEVVSLMWGVAEGSIDEPALAEWLRAHLEPR